MQQLSCSHHTRDELHSLMIIVQTQNSKCCWKCLVLGFTSFGHCLQVRHMLGVPKYLWRYYQHFQHTNSQISSIAELVLSCHLISTWILRQYTCWKTTWRIPILHPQNHDQLNTVTIMHQPGFLVQIFASMQHSFFLDCCKIPFRCLFVHHIVRRENMEVTIFSR
jgi:hypothetical protein